MADAYQRNISPAKEPPFGLSVPCHPYVLVEATHSPAVATRRGGEGRRDLECLGHVLAIGC